MKKIFLFFICFITLGASCQSTDTLNLKQFFGEREGGFCVYNLKTSNYLRYNQEHCRKRFSPCSTFKIPNSLIGLQIGVIADTGFVIAYDSLLHPRDSFQMVTTPIKFWFQDLSLKNAFKYSCVWYYQELARRVGQDFMKKQVELINYGNNDISSGIDKYWLCGSIQISIDEQIEFLKKFYLHELKGFSDRNLDAVKSIMLYETTEGYKLYGKTGGGDCWDDKTIGWYVGFVETESGTYLFAMNILVKNFDDLKNNLRIELTKMILKELKII